MTWKKEARQWVGGGRLVLWYERRTEFQGRVQGRKKGTFV